MTEKKRGPRPDTWTPPTSMRLPDDVVAFLNEKAGALNTTRTQLVCDLVRGYRDGKLVKTGALRGDL